MSFVTLFSTRTTSPPGLGANRMRGTWGSDLNHDYRYLAHPLPDALELPLFIVTVSLSNRVDTLAALAIMCSYQPHRQAVQGQPALSAGAGHAAGADTRTLSIP